MTLWQHLRRDVSRGWDASYHDHQTLPRIEEWYWPFWGEQPATVPVHVLTCGRDWRLTAWALASLFHFSEMAWPVVIHDDGTLDDEGRGTLETLFDGCRIISREEADAAMTRLLRAYPFCADYRLASTRALKLFDVAHFADAERLIVLDSDVLFFGHPRHVVDWAAGRNTRECWFIEDARESSLVTAAEAREELEVKLWSRVNTGLALVQKSALDLDFCDRALALTSVLRGDAARVEQTLFALCASRVGKGGLLPKSYEVSLQRRATEGVIARHYVGPVRDRFYGEGLKRLASELLAEEED